MTGTTKIAATGTDTGVSLSIDGGATYAPSTVERDTAASPISLAGRDFTGLTQSEILRDSDRDRPKANE
jgi:hypothetical protein